MAYTDRIHLINPTISEALSGQMPTLELLQFELSGELSDERDREARIGRAVTLVANNSELVNRFNATEDLPSALFIGSIKLLSEAHVATGGLTGPRSRKPQTFEEARPVIEARKQMQGVVETYLTRFKRDHHRLKYRALDSIAYDAACLLLDTRDLWGEPSIFVRTQLSGMLAERKVVDGLRRRSIETRPVSDREDFDEHRDCVIAASRYDLPTNLGLQVKGNSEATQELEVREHRKTGDLIVEVPMHWNLSQFDLSVKQTRTLAQAVEVKILKMQRDGQDLLAHIASLRPSGHRI